MKYTFFLNLFLACFHDRTVEKDQIVMGEMTCRKWPGAESNLGPRRSPFGVWLASSTHGLKVKV